MTAGIAVLAAVIVMLTLARLAGALDDRPHDRQWRG